MKLKLKDININKRMVILIVFLVVVAVGALFKKKVYVKNKKEISSLDFDLERIKNEIEIIQTEIPNLEEINLLLEKNRKDFQELQKKDEKYQEGIPSESDIDSFLSYLTAFEKKDKLDFLSIKPISGMKIKEQKENEAMPFKQRDFSMKVKGSLENIVDYIYYLDGISTAVTISKASIVLMDAGDKRYLQGNLDISVLFSDRPTLAGEEGFHPEVHDKLPADLKANAFFRTIQATDGTGEEEVLAEDVLDIKIDGIIKMGGRSRVIVNKDILKEGDSIQNMKIISIQDNKIILSGNKGEIVLTVEE